MSKKVEIAKNAPSDISELETLYNDAFPDEDLVPLLGELLSLPEQVISLVATHEGKVVGHVAFTYCAIEARVKEAQAEEGVVNEGKAEESRAEKYALLGPLAVTPPLHKQGIGGKLVREGFAYLKSPPVSRVFVLGDPAYYARFGFKREKQIATPYPLPEHYIEGWQSLALTQAQEKSEGILTVPAPWRRPELWSA